MYGYPATMLSGQIASATVVMRNIGTAVWPANTPYHLGMVTNPGTSDYTWGPPGYANAGSPTVRNGLQTFTMQITAPVVTTSTQVPLGFQMFHEPATFFGDVSTPVSIQVAPPPAPVIGVQPGDWQPKPALVNQTITAPINASVTANPYQSPTGDSISQHWAWATGGVYGSADGSPGSFTPATDYVIGWDQGSAATQFRGSFSNPGYYIVAVTATLTYHDDTTGQDVCTASGSGYIGGSISDLASSGSSAASANVLPANALSAHQALQPRSTGTMTVDGIAVATPTISFIGTTPDTNGDGGLNILIGQGCTASLSGIPSGCTVSNYSWSVSGFTFQAWGGTIPAIPPASANANASYEVDGPGPLNNSTAHWYWDDLAGVKTVTCNATVTPPNGQGSAFPITVTQNVSLAVPQTSESPSVGRVQINTHGPTVYGTNPALYVGGTSSQPYGIIFTTQVLTPAMFASPSSGIWNMVQGVAPNLWETPYQRPEQADASNGSTDLDTHYPFYPFGTGSSPFFPSGIAANNLIAQPYDGPGIPNLSNTIVRYRVSESFKTYVMYLPPGSDTQWVPVWLVTWFWNADDAIPTFWSNWNDANDAGTVGISSNAPTLIFPTWNIVTHG